MAAGRLVFNWAKALFNCDDTAFNSDNALFNCDEAEGICGNGSVRRLSKLPRSSIIDWTTETFFLDDFDVLGFD